ncbi:MAG: F0F1 ATP synthase subunit delta [Verrucomicrobiales bacterium]
MKVSKTALSTGRRIFRLCQVEGRMDEGRLRLAIDKLVSQKPRDYRAILQVLRRLVKAELQSKSVLVESAVQLDPQTAERLTADLRQKYGQDLTFEFVTNTDLIGGLRIRVGNDVFDGSVKSRLDRLANAF